MEFAHCLNDRRFAQCLNRVTEDYTVGKRILLVEDEANIREAISFILSRDGWDVLGHGKGETAVDEIARVAPDLVVLDVMLPGRSGLEILRSGGNAVEAMVAAAATIAVVYPHMIAI